MNDAFCACECGVSDGKKQWQALLCKYLELEASEISDYYARRWAIEVFFKDAKQMLNLGKEQSRTFDAAVSSYSIVMLRHLLLVFLMSKRITIGSFGTFFRELSKKQTFLHMVEKIWDYVKELIIKSSHLVCYEIELDTVLQLFNIAENNLFDTGRLVSTKL